jgi:hypothetical protein
MSDKDKAKAVVRASMPAIVKAVLDDRVDEYLTKLIK